MNEPFTHTSADAMQVCINIFDCVLAPQSAIYLSTPITTGWRYYLWSQQNGTQNEFVGKVLEPNIAAAALTAKNISIIKKINVINPAVFYQKGWTQKMYLSLWVDVIQRFAAEVWFNDGWEYSNGCTHEFLVAVQAGRPCFTSTGNPLSLGKAIEAIRHALSEMRLCGMDTEQIEATVHSLSEGTR